MNNHLQFTLTIPGNPGDFQVLAFSGREAIGAPFRFDLELVSDDADIDLLDALPALEGAA